MNRFIKCLVVGGAAAGVAAALVACGKAPVADRDAKAVSASEIEQMTRISAAKQFADKLFQAAVSKGASGEVLIGNTDGQWGCIVSVSKQQQQTKEGASADSPERACVQAVLKLHTRNAL